MSNDFAVRADIYRRSRAVFVRHWIDLGRLTVHVSANVVNVHGTLKRLPGVNNPITPKVLETIFADIKRMPQVKRVNARLNNWEKDMSGGWHEVENKEKKKSNREVPLHVIKTKDAIPPPMTTNNPPPTPPSKD